MVAMDCNFRTRNRDNRSNEKTSPTLGNGMAYMVPDKEYDDFTENSKNQQEVRRYEVLLNRDALMQHVDEQLLAIRCHDSGESQEGQGLQDNRGRRGILLKTRFLVAELCRYSDKGRTVRVFSNRYNTAD